MKEKRITESLKSQLKRANFGVYSFRGQWAGGILSCALALQLRLHNQPPSNAQTRHIAARFGGCFI